MEVVRMHDRRKGGHARLRKQPARCQIPSWSSAPPTTV